MMLQWGWPIILGEEAGIERLICWICGGLLGVICFLDIRKRLIPNSIVLPATFTFLCVRVIHPLEKETFTTHMLAMLLAFVLLYVTAIVTKGGLGGGDIKLAALLGLIVGRTYIISLLLVAGISTIALAILLARQPRIRKEGIPFACCLTIGWLFTYVGRMDVLHVYAIFFLP
ncbi:prepilin peptidase [Brevibacillus laterosporus]|uniref:Putative Flp pilus assembly protein n=2 Tax=Brevibacillus laterosporus TaxID=1465 RepID=A0A075R307_BRELA|nr:A24 family peptidase [Brevibacillus laterosporus]AIG25578.1 putative Flp pilus assembly protein [Brevibacillus laterosporus LMG 15441]RJL07071.1 prepilin peptidase [Brevibacillus laterosporus]TPH11324.1 prepilin peptidase [Brevibacillus laterosporus]